MKMSCLHSMMYSIEQFMPVLSRYT